MRIDCGPGYRVYFANPGAVLVLFLCVGYKSSQEHDIEKAIHLVKEWREK